MNRASSVRLHWPGKDRPRPCPEVRLEVRKPGHPASMLVFGDNLAVLKVLQARTGPNATLVYLDPPFFTNRQHLQVHRRRDEKTGKLVRKTTVAFDDRWQNFEDYLTALAERVEAARALLAPHGCLVLHVDPKTSHYAKVLCDEIFGPRAFASEIVWRYRRWPSKTPNFQRVHDTLLRYVRDPDVTPRFRQLYEPLAPSTLATWGANKQRAIVDPDGRRSRSSTTSEVTPGAPLGDVWDVGIVAPVSKERTGYPTQKPEQLIDRLVQACTHEGDLVIDPYAGSGTTLAVCARLGRRAIGIDDNREALATMRRRLQALGIDPLEEHVARALPSEPRAVRRSTKRSRAA